MIRFSAPWLLLVAVPLALFALWRLRSLPQAFGGRRRVVQALSGLAVVAAVLAAGGLELGQRVDRLAVVFALDRSRSVGGAESQSAGETHWRREIAAAAESMTPGDRAGLVVFASRASTEVLPREGAPLGHAAAPIPRDSTDVGAGIRRALADLPSDYTGRIVVVSDGVENRGDAVEAATLAAGRGVVVDVWPVERAPLPEVSAQQLRVPPSARAGEPIDVRVVTRATQDTPAVVRVSRNGEVIAQATTTIRAGTDLLVLREVAFEPGVHRYDVAIEPVNPAHDAGRENNRAGAFMRVTDGHRVLIASDAPASVSALASAIQRERVSVDVRDARSFPIGLGELAGYDLVVLSDLSARALTEDQMLSLRSYVRDLGGGLLMAGARGSFGLGGYTGTPVEDALPARFDLRRRRDRLSLSMIIAIDKSGSMMMEATPGRTKLDLANEAAARSATLLSSSDRVGVMHVDTATTWTQPMTDVENPSAIAARCRAAQPGGGGIDVDVAMRDAYRALGAETSQLKHFLLFSDGSDSQGLSGTRQMVRQALAAGITTSVVSMGNGPDTAELEALSRLGTGRFYIVEDMTRLPAIFTQETIEAARAGLVEEPFRAQRGVPSATTRGVDIAGAPPLLGHAVVNPRPQASVLLRANDEDPLLATWQHGIGRGAVFTTDVGAEFGSPWLRWGGYRVIFDQLARDLARAPEQRDARVSMTIEGGVGRVRVEALSEDGRYRNYLEMDATVARPGGGHGELTLQQTGPGRYEGTFDADAPGPYLVSVREGERGLVGSAGMVRPSGDELRGDGTDHALLGQVAALTGGVVREDLSEVFSDRPPPTWSHDPLWPWLLMLALLAMLMSVTTQRVVWPAFLKRAPKRASAGQREVSAPRPSGQQSEPKYRPGAAASVSSTSAPPGSTAGAAAEVEPASDVVEAPPASLAEQLLKRKKGKK